MNIPSLADIIIKNNNFSARDLDILPIYIEEKIISYWQDEHRHVSRDYLSNLEKVQYYSLTDFTLFLIDVKIYEKRKCWITGENVPSHRYWRFFFRERISNLIPGYEVNKEHVIQIVQKFNTEK